ncbi:DNA polymerase III subunit delta' [Shewanella sp. ULN5]|uniref:DNA polymerase III subunit delta' n=1 Tax=Shewanella sp. ULN5 TaxID=2994678 RepID=UPI00273E8017|nr:DNA polymerase III subunit delta' [Shewanella sp. ULN5]MDP5145339.1 DNA polymerase III subunit delta' [Shewanella sp. ULN5]
MIDFTQANYRLTQLPWLLTPFERFARLCYRNEHSHAQLIPVDVALGGIQLAGEMAQMALCMDRTPVGACGKCKACLLFKAGNHPDLHWIRSDGSQIKVDQIRELCQSLIHTAQQSGARVAVIEHSERMNIAAANALLKTLEEPGNNTLLLLQTDTPANLLPTITSRCQKIAFITPTRNDIISWLAQQDLLPQADAQGNRHDVTWCLGVVGGPIKLAESLTSKHYQQLLDYRQDWSASLQSGHLQNSLLKLSEQQIIDALKVLYLYLRQYVLKSNKLNPLIQARVIGLAGDVMHMSHKLTTMANVNTQALCQNYVLQFRHVLALT